MVRESGPACHVMFTNWIEIEFTLFIFLGTGILLVSYSFLKLLACVFSPSGVKRYVRSFSHF